MMGDVNKNQHIGVSCRQCSPSEGSRATRGTTGFPLVSSLYGVVKPISALLGVVGPRSLLGCSPVDAGWTRDHFVMGRPLTGVGCGLILVTC